jgi:FdhD protein
METRLNESGERKIVRLQGGELKRQNRPVVQEYPLRLRVNGSDLATLVASPHRLNFLVAGFFRLQGFIDSLDDLLSLGICSDFGLADVRIKGEVPERLAPTLTSGCGTGISFNLPDTLKQGRVAASSLFSAEAVFTLMKNLAARAENYREHGGIHSAAIGDGKELLLYAEDIGRHNTVDRLAGEALFRNVDLQGKLLVTSGRISTELVAKAARLGIAVIASRTSPTDLAIDLAEQAGITLIGYVRGEAMEIYSHPEQIAALAPGRIRGISGVILAGGESRRMGSDKSLLPIRGARFIDHVYRRLSELFEEVIIVTNSPTLYEGIPCRKVPDIYHAQGSLAGIHSGICHARHERVFVVGCDMPFVDPDVVRHICARAGEGDVVIPVGEDGSEPLHALYGKICLPAMEEVLDAGQKRIVAFFPQVKVAEVGAREWSALDPAGLSFRNINTPQEYFSLRDGSRNERPEMPMRLRRAGEALVRRSLCEGG